MPLALNIETFEHPQLADGDGETLGQEMFQLMLEENVILCFQLQLWIMVDVHYWANAHQYTLSTGNFYIRNF